LNRSTQSSQRKPFDDAQGRENVAAIVFGSTRTKFPQRFFGGIGGNKEEAQALHTYSFLALPALWGDFLLMNLAWIATKEGPTKPFG
jgi:hypothetical protein